MNEQMQTFPVVEVVEHNPTLKTFYFKVKTPVKPGQFVLMWLPGLDEKPFSVSDQKRGRLEITIKAIGPFTKKAMELEPGDRVGLRGPFGRGFEVQDNALIVGAGCGVAPVRFLHETAKRMEVNTTLLIGARNSAEVLFKDQYVDEGATIVTDDGSLGGKGLVPDRVREMLASGSYSTICASGPEVVLVALRNIAKEHNLPVQLSFERYMKCAIGICGQCCLDGSGIRVCVEGPVLTHEELQGGGGVVEDDDLVATVLVPPLLPVRPDRVPAGVPGVVAGIGVLPRDQIAPVILDGGVRATGGEGQGQQDCGQQPCHAHVIPPSTHRSVKSIRSHPRFHKEPRRMGASVN